jgi:hypothetical protein
MSYDKPAKGGQLRYITLLCMRLGIRQLLEEQPMSRGEAGLTIHHLKAQARKGGKKHGQTSNY